MITQLVKWRELENDFQKLFPRTIEAVFHSEETATVRYCGTQFEIRPIISDFYESLFTGMSRQNFHFVSGFEVWGPPAINQFTGVIQ